MVNAVHIIPGKHQHINMLAAASGLKYQVQSHRAAGMAVGICTCFFILEYFVWAD